MVLTGVPSTSSMSGGQAEVRRSKLFGVGVAATMKALAKRDRVAIMKCILA